MTASIKTLPARLYGWLPDIPDGRDYVYTAVKPRARVSKMADLREKCPVVEDQDHYTEAKTHAISSYYRIKTLSVNAVDTNRASNSVRVHRIPADDLFEQTQSELDN